MQFLLLLAAFFLLPSAEAAPNVAAAPAQQKIVPGARVLVKGRFQRKCAARVESLPAPGYARLSFDRAGCGDAAQPYELRQLQNLTFVDQEKGLRQGVHVVVQGFRTNACLGRVREITKAGYVAVDFDSLLCADTDTLRKATELTKVETVSEAASDKAKFKVGQHVAVPGILESESCAGTIRTLTDNGFAALDFGAASTCAYGGRLFPLGELKTAAAPGRRRQASGERIFMEVMRQIASQQKKQPGARRAGL